MFIPADADVSSSVQGFVNSRLPIPMKEMKPVPLFQE